MSFNHRVIINKVASALTLVFAITFAVSPFLTPGFGGYQPDQFPIPQNNPAVQPEGLFFGIWLVIYTWLIASGAFSLFLRADDADWAKSRWPLVASLSIGTSWIFIAKWSPPIATVIIFLMLGFGLTALFLAGKTDQWWQRAPIALYTGWLTAASGLSCGLLLAGYGFTSETTAALIVIAAVGVVALTVQYFRKDTPTYLISVVWGLVGIAVHNIINTNHAVLAASLVGAVLLGARCVQLFIAQYRACMSNEDDKDLEARLLKNAIVNQGLQSEAVPEKDVVTCDSQC